MLYLENSNFHFPFSLFPPFFISRSISKMEKKTRYFSDKTVLHNIIASCYLHETVASRDTKSSNLIGKK